MTKFEPEMKHLQAVEAARRSKSTWAHINRVVRGYIRHYLDSDVQAMAALNELERKVKGAIDQEARKSY